MHDDQTLARLRAAFQDSLRRASDATGPTSEDPPEYIYGTPAPSSVGPPAQVYAEGGTVDFPWDSAADDYGAGRFTRTPAERRENRERAIAQHKPTTDDWLSREWDRFIAHPQGPLGYGMEALGRLDNAAGAAREGEYGISVRDLWDIVSPDPQLRRDYGYPGAVADALSIASFPASGPVGKAMSWATPLLYGAGEGAMGALGFDDGGLVDDDDQEYAGGGKVSRLIKEVGKKFGDYQASRVERAADETNLERISTQGLRDIFNPENPRLFVNMPPGDFQNYASRIPRSAAEMTPYPRSHNVPGAERLSADDKTQDWYLDNLARHMEKRGAYSSPELIIARGPRDLPGVIEHEGRHRMMAMDRLGDPRALVQLQMYGPRPFDWADMDPEGRVDWLTQKYFPRGANSMVVPQDRPVPRALYNEPYAEGGQVDDMDGEYVSQYFAGGGKVLSLLERLAAGKPKEVKLPSGEKLPAYPIREFEDVADKFASRYGNAPIESYPALDEDRARKIAEAYDVMRHDPLDPKVRRAYDALIDETMDQYRALEGTGAKFEFLKPDETDPYARSPSLGYLDLIENGRLKVFPTEQGYGTQTDISDNPLLRRVGRVGDLDNATANDAFRVVHDTLGHFGPGNPFFRAPGEERAWLNHMRAYSPDALPAATSETRGQNSWVNFGPFAERNRGASGADTVYADQKAGLLPEWVYDPEGKPGYRDGGYSEGGRVDDDFGMYHVGFWS